jgi:hypothetical protein
MAKMEQLQEVWEAKDLDGVLSFFTDDDEGTVSSDFRIIYENDDCAVTYERMTGEFNGQCSIVQLWRGSKIYYHEISLIEDPK